MVDRRQVIRGAVGAGVALAAIGRFDAIDTRLMFGDFFAKLRMNYGR